MAFREKNMNIHYKSVIFQWLMTPEGLIVLVAQMNLQHLQESSGSCDVSIDSAVDFGIPAILDEMTDCTDPNLRFPSKIWMILSFLLVAQCRILLHDGYVRAHWKQAGGSDPSHCSAEQDRLVWPVAPEKYGAKMEEIDGH